MSPLHFEPELRQVPGPPTRVFGPSLRRRTLRSVLFGHARLALFALCFGLSLYFITGGMR